MLFWHGAETYLLLAPPFLQPQLCIWIIFSKLLEGDRYVLAAELVQLE
ncbi:hypothetical protein [Chlorogloeopsis sp. ULAP02]